MSSAKLMQTVTTNIAGEHIPLKHLPNKTTALWFAGIGNALTKIQILEELTTHTFDLDFDGTSRNQKKIIGAHFLLVHQLKKSLQDLKTRWDGDGNMAETPLQHSLSSFKKSTKDPAACRLIRLSCDICGPRGDEKSECQTGG